MILTTQRTRKKPTTRIMRPRRRSIPAVVKKFLIASQFISILLFSVPVRIGVMLCCIGSFGSCRTVMPAPGILTVL